jgi:peptidoglycan hydrolase CwlO-like protein
MKISNTELKANNKVLKVKLFGIAEQLEQNAKDYETAITEYTKNIQHRDKVFKTRVESIYIWEDKNASCENAINRFDNYTF